MIKAERLKVKEIMRPLRPFLSKYKLLFALAVLVFLLCLPFLETFVRFYNILTDREQITIFINSFGAGAPAVFMLAQVFQVVFAPIPGEATGFIGGYLFGAVKGFVYSSIALFVGSWINFTIGRFLGKRYIRKLMPADKLNRFDTILKRQGIIVVSILFIFPGFPKDYLCLFLGLTAIPFKVFILIASIGRMPGTYMLSLQGACLYKQMYGMFALIFGLCIVFAFIAFRYREDLYQWIERFNGN
jgi:uncharacterized membrane protein YdjX (TVP38/TMEM64 family)